MILGTAGHIDHGKTALVRALTGFDTDRLPEEKRRGITIDLGFAPLHIDGLPPIGVVDVPGHEAFVRTMLAGASGIDMAVLIIAADEGLMPQTREHLSILSLLDVPVPIVALTKSDLVDPEWCALVGDESRAEVVRVLGSECEVVAVSSVTGQGMSELRDAIRRAIPSSRSSDADDLFRMPIDRVFTIRGTGTVVSGTVWSGSVTRDGTVAILPGTRTSRLRRLESHGEQVERVGPGQRCAIALSDVDVADLQRGNVVVGGPGWRATTAVKAEVSILPDFAGEIGPRTRLRIHLGTAEVGGSLRGSAGFPAAGETRVIDIVLDAPLVARGGDRFVIRLPSPARTIGGGEIIDPFPPRRARRDAAPATGRGLLPLIESGGTQGISLDSLPLRTGLSPARISAAVGGDDSIVTVAGMAYTEGTITALTAEAIRRAILDGSNDSLSPGVSLQTMRSALGLPAGLAEEVFRRAAESGRVDIDSGLISAAGWKARPSPSEQKIAEQMAHDICTSGREPPSVSELVERHGHRVPDLLRYLEGEGTLVQVEAGRFYDASVVSNMAGQLRNTLVQGRIYGPAELRDLLGFSRKYLIPFLEYCDRIGVTERKAEGRALRFGG